MLRALCSSGVGGEAAAAAAVVGGVSERFRRRPAICGGSGGGDPDMGGVGRDAQTGTAVGFGSVRLIANLDWSRLDLWFLKDGKRRGKLGGRVCCMENCGREVDLLSPHGCCKGPSSERLYKDSGINARGTARDSFRLLKSERYRNGSTQVCKSRVVGEGKDQEVRGEASDGTHVSENSLTRDPARDGSTTYCL